MVSFFVNNCNLVIASDTDMCGRYSVGPSVVTFAQEFDPSFQDNSLPVYNASPGRQLPLVLDRMSQRIEMYTWGFIPAWVKEDTHQLLINARCESVEIKGSLKDCFRNQRCLVLSDGYYEWKKTTQGKQPYHISLRHIESFAMAGLWQRRSDGEGRFCIITTTAADSIRSIHDRMPVILPPYQYDLWYGKTPR